MRIVISILFIVLLFSCSSIGKSISGNCKNGYGVFKYSNGQIYEGEWKNGEREGYGELRTYIGRVLYEVYKGKWKNDIPYGEGVIYKPGGAEYHAVFGHFENWHTPEKYVLADGSIFEGTGGYHPGKFTFSDGSTVEGVWQNCSFWSGFSLENKEAVFTFPDGTTYKGVWYVDEDKTPEKIVCIKGNNVNGNGVIISNKGYLYSGAFRNGKRSGVGTMWKIATRGMNYYKGEWKDDAFHGNGTFKALDGILTKTGNWYKGKLHGSGIFIDNQHDAKYEGEYCHGKQDGYGVLSYGLLSAIDEKNPIVQEKQYGVYRGYFRDNDRDGYGVLIRQDNTKIEGIWLSDNYVGYPQFVKGDGKNGYVEYLFTDGSHYEGEYHNGKRNGKGTFTNLHLKKYNEKTVYSGEWKDDYEEGEGVYILYVRNKIETKYEGNWKHGRENGKGKLWIDGVLKQEGRWCDGLFEGSK